MAVWVNGKFLNTENKKSAKWNPKLKPEQILWGTCQCGSLIYEGDSVGMHGEHEHVICYSCWITGLFPEFHLDCCGLKFPDVTLSQ